MNRHILLTLAAVSVLLAPVLASAQEMEDPESCTSIVVGRKASADGSVMTSHTCDGVSHTWVRIVPAADHPKDAVFEVFKGLRKTEFYGDTAGVVKVGEIPEVRHTYAYLDTGYPSLNEKQVAIGESTFTGPDTLINKNAMFLIEELARIALMRCDNARDAVKLMGSLAEQYGYGDTGECLTVADKKEAWFFEILGVGKDRTGAVWAAQRVPDGQVAVAANIPRIGRIDRKDRKNYMCSDNVESVAREFGLWDGEGDFIFWKAYNVPRAKGKNFSIREWFILNELAPSLGLQFDADELPFSVTPETPVDVRDVMKLFRSTYEGTEYDMCRDWVMDRNGRKVVSPVANPWLVADTRNTLNTVAPGTIDFRRTVAVCWCAYSTVLQLRDWLPDAVGGICWLGLDNPGESPRIPIFAGNTSLPEAFNVCGHKRYRPESALWQFRRANRLGTVAWQKDKDLFEKNILEMEEMAVGGLPEVDSLGKKVTSEALDAYTRKIYEEAAERWRRMEYELWHRHGRGF